MDNKVTKKIYILLDYDNRFYSEWDKHEFSLDKFAHLLKESGIEIEILKFSEINFQKINFNNKIVLYSSCEVGKYKDYIEDILLGIKKQGGVLVPNFYLFRAHHNKCFQEIYKKILNFGNLQGKSFGSFKEFSENILKFKFPLVLKIPDGSGSKKVCLLENHKQAKKKSKQISSIFDSLFKKTFFSARAVLAYLMGIRDKERIYRNNTNKFVIQEYVPGLQNDWKILIYSNHYYALKRGVKKNDFRASGSYKFTYETPPENLLNFCHKINETIKSPYLSLDVAIKKDKCYLIEFQALYFGIYTILYADFFYTKNNNNWIKIKKSLTVEEEMARSLLKFINESFNL
ncbi:hypothetical protein K9K85_01180 [Patescibacteria group bacterium]|nr:hypothetical protein [Patescibacteria group bacterium]